MPSRVALAGLVAIIAVAVTLALAGPATTSRQIASSGEELDVINSGAAYTRLDPAFANNTSIVQLLYSTCLKLVNWPDRSGARVQLVPDGAAAMPVVSDHGRTYTFTVKAGQRFNTGAPVTAANFKAAFDRDADPKMASAAPTYVNDIVGVDAELQGKATGVSGVVAAGMKLTIRIKRADPTLLERLAMPFFCAIPTGLAHDPNGIDTVPAAGPYYIASFTPDRDVVLKQNPFYAGSRPRRAGTINVTIGEDSNTAYQQVRAGQYALDLNGPPYQYVPGLANEFGINKRRLFISPTLITGYLPLNTSRPALKNPKVRQAINYALCRRCFTDIAPLLSTPGSQMLPPALTAGQRTNPYPMIPNLAKARSLLRGVKCGQLVFWSGGGAGDLNAAQLLKTELAKIGCNLRIDIIPGNLYSAMGIKGAAFDIGPASWAFDYPDPYDILYHLLDGNTIAPSGNYNYSYINDPALNKAIEKTNLLPLGRARLQAFAKLDYDTMRNLAPVAVVGYPNWAAFLAANTGGYIYSTFGANGADLDTLYHT